MNQCLIPKTGLSPIRPDRRDHSLLHTFGTTTNDVAGLPKSFSNYDGRPIPNQSKIDDRFTPAVRPLPLGCVGETITFDAGLQDNALYPPDDFYFAVPPGTDTEGRDIRAALKVAIKRGFKLPDGSLGANRTAYFNCYGAGPIDDYDAARIALWLNQHEKRSVIVGTWWYPEYAAALPTGILPLPSFNIKNATLHAWLATGWDSTYKADYIEGISWQGMNYGDGGRHYVSREIYNAMMQQPWTGAFTITKTTSKTPIPIGIQADIDHFVYWFRNTFNV